MKTADVCAATVLVFGIACGGGGDTPSGTGNGGGNNNPPEVIVTNAIDVRDNSFSPSAATVVPGTTVTWTWRGNADHDVTFTDGAASARLREGTYERTFPTAGTFNYQCTIHGSGMSGSVVVK